MGHPWSDARHPLQTLIPPQQEEEEKKKLIVHDRDSEISYLLHRLNRLDLGKISSIC